MFKKLKDAVKAREQRRKMAHLKELMENKPKPRPAKKCVKRG